MIERIGQPPRLADGRQVPISPAVRAGNLVFVSGQLGLDAAGRLVSEDVGAQTRQVLENLKAVLEQAGCSLEQIVKANIWIVDPVDFPAVNRVWADTFGAAPPARSTVVSGLLIAGARIEVDVVAVAA